MTIEPDVKDYLPFLEHDEACQSHTQHQDKADDGPDDDLDDMQRIACSTSPPGQWVKFQVKNKNKLHTINLLSWDQYAALWS